MLTTMNFTPRAQHAQYLLEIAGRAGKANERVTQVTARQQVMLTWARRFVLEKHLLADERLNARRQALEQARAAQRTRRQAMAAAAHRARHARLAPVTSLDDHRPTPVLVPSASLTLVDGADADEDELFTLDEIVGCNRFCRQLPGMLPAALNARKR